MDQHKNFAYSSVATAPSPASSGTSLVVATGQGALFPTPPFNATVWATGEIPIASNAEIVRVTNISTDTFTITRAQESTSARSIVVGDQIAATITAKTLTDVEEVAAMALLYDLTLGSDTASFDVSSISGSYKHLRVIASLRSDANAVNDTWEMTFNNDTGTNYSQERLLAFASAASADQKLTQAYLLGDCPAATGLSNEFGGIDMLVYDYASTAKNKAVSWQNPYLISTASNLRHWVGGGSWRSTSAIDRITIVPSAGSNFKTSSRLTIYGLA